MSIWRVGVLNDLHIPYHDPAAVMLSLEIFKDAGVNEIVLNGDVLDFYNLSRYEKHPDMQEKLEDELNAGKAFFKMLRTMFPNEKIMFIYGNHEDRLNSYVFDLSNSLESWRELAEKTEIIGQKEIPTLGPEPLPQKDNNVKVGYYHPDLSIRWKYLNS